MLHIADEFAPLLSSIADDPSSVFTRDDIKPWRTLADRENCVWEILDSAGRTHRFHVKRYPASHRHHAAARAEANGYAALAAEQIPAARVAAWGELSDGRSFIVIQDLAGFTPADKLIAAGAPFAELLAATASLAAQLHNAGLHHRDLYLCHFLAKLEPDGPPQLRLIDAARVRRLPLLFPRRWIVKDLAQFWFSSLDLPITNTQRQKWLKLYTTQTAISRPRALRRAILRKCRVIARHDAVLNQREPRRNISIPQTPGPIS